MAAIHCLALNEDDFTQFDGLGSHIVWSPFSNALLYGRTIDPRNLESRPFTVGCDCRTRRAVQTPESVPLDGLTVVDDEEHFARLENIGHLPEHLKKLRAMYA